VLLTGMTVTVFPGESSRSLAEAAAVLAGWVTGSGMARTGAETVIDARLTLGSRGRELKAGRTVRCWTRSWCVSTGEAISTAGVCGASVRSRCGREPTACSLPWDPHPAATATKAMSGNRKLLRMKSSRSGKAGCSKLGRRGGSRSHFHGCRCNPGRAGRVPPASSADFPPPCACAQPSGLRPVPARLSAGPPVHPSSTPADRPGGESDPCAPPATLRSSAAPDSAIG
jgi:hypothetical protein